MTDYITPQEADRLIYNAHEVVTDKVKDGTDGENWQVQWKDSYWNRLPDAPYEDAVLYAAAPRLAATIAADTIEYGVEFNPHDTNPDLPDLPSLCYLTDDMDLWVRRIEVAKGQLGSLRKQNPNVNYRLVARRVSPTWEVKE